MMRAASGIASPASPSGYPVPSQFSWVERTITPTGRNPGAALRMRWPIRVWEWMKPHSVGSSGPGLLQDDVRDRELADVVELGGEP